ncbi:MAG TPA: DoxX family protein [Acidobacteriaceae bacterium]
MQSWIKSSSMQASVPRDRKEWIRTVGYWIFTLLIAYEMAAGGIWDLLRIEYVRVVLAHLGYPMYLLTIIGIWKIPCALVLVVPGFKRLKEWAYAGAFSTTRERRLLTSPWVTAPANGQHRWFLPVSLLLPGRCVLRDAAL